MTAATFRAGEPATRELAELYARHKALTLATGAALVLGARTDELAREASALLADCRVAAAAGADRALQTPLAACVRAAEELHLLSAGAAADPGSPSPPDTERARDAHRRLRREVWKVIPCEYVPCSAADRHAHGYEH